MLENKEQTDRLLIALKRLVLLVRSSINRFYAQNIYRLLHWALSSVLNQHATIKSRSNYKQLTKKMFQTFELIKKTAVICFAFGFRAEWMNFKGWLEEVIKSKKTKTNGVHQKFNTIQIEYFKM